MSKTPPSRNPGIAWYDTHATSAAERYEALSFPQVHNWLLYRLPERRDATVLDIGAGSGREVVALEHRSPAREPGDHECNPADGG